MLHIFVDADACPVKDEIYRVAGRHGLNVHLVANSWMQHPQKKSIQLEVVGSASDEADDWIVEQVEAGDIVITSDIPLASRSVKKGARVLTSTGKILDEDNVASALATRDLMTELRSEGEMTSGPPPLRDRDRSRFLQQLETVIQALKRGAR